MKGILKGCQPVDYISKKTNEPVKGITLFFDCKNKDVFGYASKEEFISEASPLYKRLITPLIEKLYDETSDVYGAEVAIDYDVQRRNGNTYTSIVDLQIIPRADNGKSK